MKLFISLLLLAVVQGEEFLTFLGKKADPCNKYLSANDFRVDCPINSQQPASSVTVLLPATISSAVAPALNSVPTLTIVGVGLPTNRVAAVAAGTTFVALATGTDTCGTIQAGTQVAATTNSQGTILTFDVNGAWQSSTLELEDRPRMLCWSPGNAAGPYRYTGFKVGVAFNCDTTRTDAQCNDINYRTMIGNSALTSLQKQQKLARTFCCKSKIGLNVGRCINPNVQSCCGGAAFEVANERCCNSANEVISTVDGRCPCGGSNSLACPDGETCCLPTKYSHFQNVVRSGQCYRSDRDGCCDTGSIFDLGSQQCCSINGVQTLNKPCPCSTDNHCKTVATPDHLCCQQVTPVTFEAGDNCDANAYFPTGQGPAETAPCAGACFDPKYSICCNGVKCIKTYERCCNSTCCNRFMGTCVEGLRPSGFGRKYDGRNYGVRFQQCSQIEFLSTVKAFWVFVFPAGLLASSLAALALTLVFASKATPRSLSYLENFIVAGAMLTMFLAMPLYFAPVYKYGIWIIFVMAVVIITAAARVYWLNVLAVVVLFITVVYVFDPFFGNAWLTLASNRVYPVGQSAPVDLETSGLLHAIAVNWRTVDQSKSLTNFCVQHYDWFQFDPLLRDVERFDNPEIVTFGYCSRGWVTALIFFSFCIMGLILILLVLLIAGLFFRFHQDRIELEVQEEFAY